LHDPCILISGSGNVVSQEAFGGGETGIKHKFSGFRFHFHVPFGQSSFSRGNSNAPIILPVTSDEPVLPANSASAVVRGFLHNGKHKRAAQHLQGGRLCDGRHRELPLFDGCAGLTAKYFMHPQISQICADDFQRE
jgi:hypothetical protein